MLDSNTSLKRRLDAGRVLIRTSRVDIPKFLDVFVDDKSFRIYIFEDGLNDYIPTATCVSSEASENSSNEDRHVGQSPEVMVSGGRRGGGSATEKEWVSWAEKGVEEADDVVSPRELGGSKACYNNCGDIKKAGGGGCFALGAGKENEQTFINNGGPSFDDLLVNSLDHLSSGEDSGPPPGFETKFVGVQEVGSDGPPPGFGPSTNMVLGDNEGHKNVNNFVFYGDQSIDNSFKKKVSRAIENGVLEDDCEEWVYDNNLSACEWMDRLFQGKGYGRKRKADRKKKCYKYKEKCGATIKGVREEHASSKKKVSVEDDAAAKADRVLEIVDVLGLKLLAPREVVKEKLIADEFKKS